MEWCTLVFEQFAAQELEQEQEELGKWQVLAAAAGRAISPELTAVGKVHGKRDRGRTLTPFIVRGI